MESCSFTFFKKGDTIAAIGKAQPGLETCSCCLTKTFCFLNLRVSFTLLSHCIPSLWRLLARKLIAIKEWNTFLAAFGPPKWVRNKEKSHVYELILFLREKILVVGKWLKIAYSDFPQNFLSDIIYPLSNNISFSLELSWVSDSHSNSFQVPN